MKARVGVVNRHVREVKRPPSSPLVSQIELLHDVLALMALEIEGGLIMTVSTTATGWDIL